MPGIGAHLAAQICHFVQWIREQDLFKRPGIAEMIDWAEALAVLHADDLDPALVQTTLGCILKYQRDVQAIGSAELARAVERVRSGIPAGGDAAPACIHGERA